MAPKLSKLAETLIGSEIVKLGADIKEKIRLGDKIYNYTIGDFDSSVFPIPKELEAEIITAYQQHNTTYPPAEGIASLRSAVADFIHRRQGLLFKSNEILIAAGGRPLIYTAYRAIVDKGEKVIYAVPSWNNNHYVHFTEGEHVVVESKLENNFMPIAADLEAHLDGAVLIALCSPLNPTGTTFTRSELEKICDLVLAENRKRSEIAKKLYVLYDQIYWTLTYGDIEHHDPVSINPAMKEFTIYIDGISKSFASTGVRVGWALGPSFLIEKMKAINSHVGAWAPMAEQHAVANFLENDEAIAAFFEKFKFALQERLERIYTGFRQLKEAGHEVDAVAPQAAIYLTVQINLVGKEKQDGTVLVDQSAVTSYLLEEAKLAIVPFAAFGATGANSWYRLSVGTCLLHEIDEMLLKLKMALEKLK